MESINTQLGRDPANHLHADGLVQPLDFKGYFLTRQLTALFPDKAVMQGSEYSFDLEEFVTGGHCAARLLPDMLHHFILSFRGLGYGLREEAENAWYEVDYQGETLQVVLASWMEGSCKNKNYWIIANSKAIAGEFYLRVCEWAAEVRGEVLVFDAVTGTKTRPCSRPLKTPRLITSSCRPV